MAVIYLEDENAAECIKLLIAHGATIENVVIHDKKSETALSIAEKQQKKQCIKLLSPKQSNSSQLPFTRIISSLRAFLFELIQRIVNLFWENKVEVKVKEPEEKPEKNNAQLHELKVKFKEPEEENAQLHELKEHDTKLKEFLNNITDHINTTITELNNCISIYHETIEPLQNYDYDYGYKQQLEIIKKLVDHNTDNKNFINECKNLKQILDISDKNKINPNRKKHYQANLFSRKHFFESCTKYLERINDSKEQIKKLEKLINDYNTNPQPSITYKLDDSKKQTLADEDLIKQFKNIYKM